jgi:hypothetical protein
MGVVEMWPAGEKKSKPGGGCLVCRWPREGDGREVVFREDKVVAGYVASGWWRWVKEKKPTRSKLAAAAAAWRRDRFRVSFFFL